MYLVTIMVGNLVFDSQGSYKGGKFMAKTKRKLYSETMRDLSFLSLDELRAYRMRWGLDEVDNDIIMTTVGMEYYTSIPPATSLGLNALRQIEDSYIDPVQRKEWADRIEGKAMQTSINLNANQDVTSISELSDYTTEAIDRYFKENDVES